MVNMCYAKLYDSIIAYLGAWFIKLVKEILARVVAKETIGIERTEFNIKGMYTLTSSWTDLLKLSSWLRMSRIIRDM